MKGADGKEISPTGKKFDVELSRWDDGRIVEENLFYDLVTFMKQIGLDPKRISHRTAPVPRASCARGRHSNDHYGGARAHDRRGHLPLIVVPVQHHADTLRSQSSAAPRAWPDSNAHSSRVASIRRPAVESSTMRVDSSLRASDRLSKFMVPMDTHYLSPTNVLACRVVSRYSYTRAPALRHHAREHKRGGFGPLTLLSKRGG
jgi:hypothetical protein